MERFWAFWQLDKYASTPVRAVAGVIMSVPVKGMQYLRNITGNFIITGTSIHLDSRMKCGSKVKVPMISTNVCLAITSDIPHYHVIISH